jgi:hypothetical protein
VSDADTIVRLTGVYHADGGLAGELRYVVGKLVSRAHCALCDITHGTFTMRPQWRECEAALPVPIECVHRNERSPEVTATTGGATPCVVAHFADGATRILLDAVELDACSGDVDNFRSELFAKAELEGWEFAGA